MYYYMVDRIGVKIIGISLCHRLRAEGISKFCVNFGTGKKKQEKYLLIYKPKEVDNNDYQSLCINILK